MHVSQASPLVGASGPEPRSEETWSGGMPTGQPQGLEDHTGPDASEAGIRGPTLKTPMMSTLPVLFLLFLLQLTTWRVRSWSYSQATLIIRGRREWELLWESDSWSWSQMCFQPALTPWESHFLPGGSGLSSTKKEKETREPGSSPQLFSCSPGRTPSLSPINYNHLLGPSPTPSTIHTRQEVTGELRL